MLGVVQNPDIEADGAQRVDEPASGPLPAPEISCSTPLTLTTAVIASVPPSSSAAVTF